MRKSHAKRNRRSSRSSSRRRSTGPNWIKIGALALMPITLFAGGGVALKSMMERIDPIAGTRCYEQDGQYQSAMVIDFSMTERNSASQQKDLQTAMLNVYDALPANGKLSIFTTARDSAGGDIAVADFAVCRPPETQDEQRALANRADSRPVVKKQAEVARAEYADQVAQVLKDSQDASKTALYSPILESIQSVSRYYQRTQLNIFTLYSDGVQNSRLLKFCKVQGHMPPFGKFIKLGEYQDIKPEDFTGTHVEILLVESSTLPSPGMEYCSNRELRAFYPAFFKGHGATTQLTRIRYGASS